MNLLLPSQVQQLRDIFDLYESGGGISARDTANVLRAFGVKISDAEVQDLISEIDVRAHGRSGLVEFEEFVSLFLRRYDTELVPGFKTAEEAELKELFGLLDANGDGEVSAAELQSAFQAIGHHFHLQQIREMMHEVMGNPTSLPASISSSSSGSNSNNSGSGSSASANVRGFDYKQFENLLETLQ